MQNIKRFFGMPFWQSFAAGLLCFFVVSGGVFYFLGKTFIGIYKISKLVSETQIITTKDGTKVYEFGNNIIIERKNGTTEIIPKLKVGIKETPGKL